MEPAQLVASLGYCDIIDQHTNYCPTCVRYYLVYVNKITGIHSYHCLCHPITYDMISRHAPMPFVHLDPLVHSSQSIQPVKQRVPKTTKRRQKYRVSETHVSETHISETHVSKTPELVFYEEPNIYNPENAETPSPPHEVPLNPAPISCLLDIPELKLDPSSDSDRCLESDDSIKIASIESNCIATQEQMEFIETIKYIEAILSSVSVDDNDIADAIPIDAIDSIESVQVPSMETELKKKIRKRPRRSKKSRCDKHLLSCDHQASSDQTQSSESAKSSEHVESVKHADSAESSDHTQSSEPAESSDRAQSSESAKSSDHIQSSEFSEPAKSSDRAQSSESSEPAKSSDRTQSSGSAESLIVSDSKRAPRKKRNQKAKKQSESLAEMKFLDAQIEKNKNRKIVLEIVEKSIKPTVENMFKLQCLIVSWVYQIYTHSPSFIVFFMQFIYHIGLVLDCVNSTLSYDCFRFHIVPNELTIHNFKSLRSAYNALDILDNPYIITIDSVNSSSIIVAMRQADTIMALIDSMFENKQDLLKEIDNSFSRFSNTDDVSLLKAEIKEAMVFSPAAFINDKKVIAETAVLYKKYFNIAMCPRRMLVRHMVQWPIAKYRDVSPSLVLDSVESQVWGLRYDISIDRYVCSVCTKQYGSDVTEFVTDDISRQVYTRIVDNIVVPTVIMPCCNTKQLFCQCFRNLEILMCRRISCSQRLQQVNIRKVLKKQQNQGYASRIKAFNIYIEDIRGHMIVSDP